MSKKAKPETVLVLRTCKADMTSYNGFKWPESGPVECPDWRDDDECGHGLHGLAWGEGNGRLLDWSEDAKWLVVEVLSSDLRHGTGELTDKCKFPRGTVVYCGNKDGAVATIVAVKSDTACVVRAVTAGDGGQATAGYRGQATAGSYGQATAGEYGQATVGQNGVVMVCWWDSAAQRYRVAVGYAGENIKAGVKYRCDDNGKLVEVSE